MSNSLRYSIIYAVIRPEISERVSVGLIIVDGDNIDIRYSRQKLNAIQPFFSEKEYKLLSRVVVSMNKTVNSTDTINYLTRYSNNLISISPLQRIDITSSKQSKEKLYKWLKSELAYTSNNIEGNTLTRKETRLVIEEDITSSSKPFVHYQEAVNHAKAFDYIIDILKSKAIINENVKP